MSTKKIISIPDPVLRQISKPVEVINSKLQILLDDMLETMYTASGIGLAAIQIGCPLRVVTIDVTPARKQKEEQQETEETVQLEPDPVFLINPEILEYSDERSVFQEGCLSIPGYLADVERPASCKVRYLDRDGKEQIINAEGILAICVQHEIDHLNGILFIDYISKLKRDMVMKKFAKITKQSKNEPDESVTV